MRTVHVTFPIGEILAEIAEDNARGLTGRVHLPDNKGMIFDMGYPSDHSFWMRGVWIPLDMIFIDASRTIVGIVENARPNDDAPRKVGRMSRFVLEINGGWSKRHGVRTGQRVDFRTGA